MRTYGGLGRFIVDMGAPAVDALRRMEAKGLNLTPYNLRPLEHLLTPDARQQVMVVMASEDCRLQGLDKEIALRRHEQWCKFHWLAHHRIDDTKRMHLTPFDHVKLHCCKVSFFSFILTPTLLIQHSVPSQAQIRRPSAAGYATWSPVS